MLHSGNSNIQPAVSNLRVPFTILWNIMVDNITSLHRTRLFLLQKHTGYTNKHIISIMIGNGRDNLAWEIQTSVQGEEHDS